MQRIPITRGYDKTDPIGYFTLKDDVEIPPNWEFVLGYEILAGTRENPTRIKVHEISLVPREVAPIGRK